MLTVGCTLLCAQQPKPADRPPDLSLTAIGRYHHPIATKNKSAQDYFDQGLTLIYGFNHEEAARAFQQAAKLDPASPMPLWGIALAVGPNYNQDVDPEREKIAFETITNAAKLAQSAPQSERDYVSALAARFSGDANPDYKKLARNYADAMKSLSQKYPDDLDAATLYADSLMALNPWKLWTLDGKPNDNTEEIAAVLETVLKRDPNHVGANHFYIHACSSRHCYNNDRRCSVLSYSLLWGLFSAPQHMRTPGLSYWLPYPGSTMSWAATLPMVDSQLLFHPQIVALSSASVSSSKELR